MVCSGKHFSVIIQKLFGKNIWLKIFYSAWIDIDLYKTNFYWSFFDTSEHLARAYRIRPISAFFLSEGMRWFIYHTKFLLPLNVNCYISEWGRIYCSRLPQAWSFSMWRNRESLAFWRLWYILQFMWIFNGFRIVCNVVTNGEKFNAYDLHTFYCLVLFTLPVHIVKILIRSIIRCVATD